MRAAKFRIDRFGELQLATLNSATKYPSIPTYHILGQRGRLTEERSTEFPGEVEVTEKIDGANARIILPPPEMGTPLIGSRSQLLHSVGDVIANAAQGIVAATRTLAFQLTGVSTHPDALTVLVTRVRNYGGVLRLPAAPGTDARVFSMASPTSCRTFMSSPNTFTATSLRTPEISSLKRIWMGCVNS